MADTMISAGGAYLPSNGRQGSFLTKTNDDDNSWETNNRLQFWEIGTETGGSSAQQWIAETILSKLQNTYSGFKFVYANYTGQIWHSIVMSAGPLSGTVYATILIFNYGQTGFYKYTIMNNTLSSPKYFS